MFDWLKKRPEAKAETRPETPKPKTKSKTPKEIATEAGEPYINIVSVELDPEDIGNGSFELDWNDVFVARLVKAGYMQRKDDTDDQIVDRWFRELCANVVVDGDFGGPINTGVIDINEVKRKNQT